MRRTLLVLFILMMAVTSGAQPIRDTKILLPLVVEDPIYGAYGSKWVTRIAITNTGDRDINLGGYEQYSCTILCGTFRMTPPGVTFYPQFFVYTREVPGYFLYTVADDVPFVNVSIHAQDLSRQALTWGTEVPVVPESEAVRGRLVLSDVPRDERFRSRLRVYDFDPQREVVKQIGYRIYRVRPDLRYPLDGTGEQSPPASPDEVVAEGNLQFRVAHSGLGTTGHPGFAELDLEAAAPPVEGGRVRVELVPPDESLRYWAFVSVTNNETQHITVITP